MLMELTSVDIQTGQTKRVFLWEEIKYYLSNCICVVHKASKELFLCLTAVPKCPSKLRFFVCFNPNSLGET